MKNALLTACVIALLLVVGWTGYGQKPNPSRAVWEYMAANEHTLYNSHVDLKRLGDEGWELTAVTTRDEAVSNNRLDIVTTYYFKRQK